MAFDSADSLFCFEQISSNQKWFIYDTKAEFIRMTEKLGNDCQWVVTEANKNFKICDTYPPLLIVPKDTTEAELKKVASYRTKNRLPVAAWIHPERNGHFWFSKNIFHFIVS